MSELKILDGTFDVFDIHWYGFVGNYKEHDKVKETLVHFMEESLPTLLDGFDVDEVWMTEIGTYSGSDVVGQKNYPDQSEFDQAVELFKRYTYSPAHGISKLFWNKIVESASFSRQFDRNDYFDNLGLVYNGVEYVNGMKYECPIDCESDLGKNVKKLSYYTYKLMVEKLEGSDWNNIEIIQESDGIYVYRFTNKESGGYTWVAWSDNDIQCIKAPCEEQILIGIEDLGSVKITEAVPKYNSGKEVTDYTIAFDTEIKSINNGVVSINLGDVPVFIEEN